MHENNHHGGKQTLGPGVGWSKWIARSQVCRGSDLGSDAQARLEARRRLHLVQKAGKLARIYTISKYVDSQGQGTVDRS